MPLALLLLEIALERLIVEDRELFAVGVNERSITHRLALHLTPLFPRWDVDCEYNRSGENTKRLDYETTTVESDDTQAKTVYPDIIVHRRNRDENLLVVEVKKTDNDEGLKSDIDKLNRFVDQIGYQHAAAVLVDTDTAPDYSIEWSRPFT